MSIPVISNSSYPLIAPAISLINAFLKQEAPESIESIESVESRLVLQLRLPRGAGSTYICHQAAEFTSSLIVLPNDNFTNHFRKEHETMFRTKCLSIFSIYELQDRSSSLLNPNLARLSQISESLRSVHNIFFDAFASYSNNKIVKSLFSSCYKTHKFIMLW